MVMNIAFFSRNPPDATRLKVLSAVAVLVIFNGLGFGIYSNTLNVPFIFDDIRAIQENHNIRITEVSEILTAGIKSSFTRSIAYASFALNYCFHQYDLKGYHVVNTIIHILAGIFLFFFIKTTLDVPLLRSKYHDAALVPFFASLLWLVHPIQTQ